MPLTLTGQETFDVTGVQPNGMPSSVTERITLAQLAVYMAVAIVPPVQAGLTVTQLPALRNYQRITTSGSTYGYGAGQITQSFTNTGVITNLQYQLRDITSGAVVQAATACSVTSYSAGGGTKTASYPAVPARRGWYFIDMIPNNDPTQIVYGTSPVGMGGVIAVAGQSEIWGFFAKLYTNDNTYAAQGITPSPYGSVCATYTGGSGPTNTSLTWAIPADGTTYSGIGVAQLLNQMIAQTGFNWSVVGDGTSGVSITTYVPGGSNNAKLLAAIQAGGSSFEKWFWFQGAGDSINNVSNSTYYTNYSTLNTFLVANNSFSGFYSVLASMQPVNTTSQGAFAAVNQIRVAQSNWCAANSANAYYLTTADLDVETTGAGVGVELSSSGYVELAGHIARAYRPSLGLGGVGDRGPSLGNPTTTDNTTYTFPITQAGGTAVTFPTGWQNRFIAFAHGTTSSPLTIASGSSTSTTASITLSAASANADFYTDTIPSGQNNNSGNWPYDNNVDDGGARGRALMVSVVPLTVGGATVTAPGAVTGLAAGTPTSSGDTITWSAPSTGSAPTAYLLETNVGGAGYTTISASATSPYTLSGIAASTSVVVRVTASNTAGSGPSSTVSFTTAASGSRTTTPITLTSPVFSGNQLTGGQGTLPSSALFAATSATAQTVAFQATVPTGSPSATQAIFGAGNGTGAGSFWIGVATNGTLTGGVASSNSGSPVTTTLAVNDGNPHYFAIVMTGSAFTFYVDGNAVAGATNIAYTGNTIGTLGVRQYGVGGPTNAYFAGSIHDIAVFSGAHWTANYTPATITGSESGLTGWWQLHTDGAAY